jgi:hypothetical protein
MAEKTAPISLGYGTPAWTEYTAAQQEARDILEQRNNRLFDPTYLAMAQGFFAPTKTGSFGESLGNVAAMVGPAQQAEEKRTMDMAKMRMELAQQGLQTSIQGQNAQQDADLLARMTGTQPKTAPAMPAPVQGGAPVPPPAVAPSLPSATTPPAPQPPSSGALAQVAPPVAQTAQTAQLSPLAQAAPPAAQPAPQASAQPVGQQLFPAQPSTWDQDETAYAMAQRRAGKPMGEIMKEIDEIRRKNIVVNERGATNTKTGQVYAPVDPTPTEVRIPDKGVFTTTKTLASRLANAQANNNPEEYYKVADLITQGMKRPPVANAPTPANATPTGAAPANAPVQGGMLTKEQEEAQAARKKEMASGEAKSEVERRKTLPDDIKRYDSLARSADSLYEIVDKNPKGFGTFDKAGVLPAIGVLVRDGIRANKVSVDMGGFEDAFRAANPRIKDSDINAVRLGASEQANIELNYANMFLKGTGPITEGERAIVRRAGAGNVSMSPEVLKLRAQAVSKRASYERDDLNAYREFVAKNPDSTYLNYMDTPKFKSLFSDYDKDMRKMAGITSTKQQKGKPDLKAAGANVDKQTD